MSNLTAAQRVKIARMPGRPGTMDFVHNLFTDVFVCQGDRLCREDPSIFGAIARLHGKPVTVIGHRKGRNFEENMKCNFGMPSPEGYRKAQRLMRQAEKFGRPIITFVDTPGAYPGLEAEERGQGEAIASSLALMSSLTVPVVTVVIGEGGSGGALALAIADRVWMLENAYYSVISPESCASILFKDPSRVSEAAENLHLFADDLKELGIVEKVVAEAAEFTPEQTKKMTEGMAAELYPTLKKLLKKSPAKLTADRYEKYRKIGRYEEIGIKNV